MRSALSVGRIIGVLLVMQLSGLIVPFILLLPLTAGPASFLTHAAGIAFPVQLAVCLLFANCALTIGISFAALPVLRRHSDTLALLLVTVSAIMFSLQAVDNAHLLSMLSLSQQYTQAGGQDEHFQALAAMVRTTRRWAHCTELLAIDGWMFVLYSALLRCALVPRPLAALGLITVILHFTGITLPLLLGHRSATLMGVPMGVSHLALGLWLMARGFAEGRQPVRSQVHAVAVSAA